MLTNVTHCGSSAHTDVATLKVDLNVHVQMASSCLQMERTALVSFLYIVCVIVIIICTEIIQPYYVYYTMDCVCACVNLCMYSVRP